MFRLDVCLEGIMQPYLCAPVGTFCTSEGDPRSLHINAAADLQAGKPATEKPWAGKGSEFIAQSEHSPPFARMSYEPFSRAEAVAIAEQEWRLFGQRVDDDPPHTGADPQHADNLERSPGYWERISQILVARPECRSPRVGLDGDAR